MRSLYLVICGVRTASSTLLAAGDPKFTLSAQAWSNVHFSPWLLLHSEPRHSLFCMIPKNACSEFLALMMRAHGLSSEHWNPPAHGKHQTLVHYDTAREDMFFGDGDSHVLEGILRNRTWTKSVFLRDPVERFISAYISKVKKINKWFSQTYPSWAGNLPIDRFVSVLESEGLHENTDPHFRPQSYLCGLSQTLSQYDFIGFMSNLEEDADRMGMLMGIQDMLHEGWGPHSNQSLFGTPRSVRDGPFAMESAGTLRNAHLESRQAGAFWTDGGSGVELDDLLVEVARVRADPQLEARIRALYHWDYDLLSRARRQMASEVRASS